MDGKLKVSIVTPFHNVPRDMFENSFKSVMNQTYGVENLEYIIVIHNCSDEYREMVFEMTKDCECVKTYILNNEWHCASNPRNYALDKATGKYILFLDGDDYLSDDCVEKAVQAAETNNADMVSFRAGIENDNPDDSFDLKLYTLMDQTQDMVVFEKDTPSWNPGKFLNGKTLSVTFKLYNADIIRDNNLRFNSEIVVAEDNEFNLRFIQISKKLVFLPSYIGYTYVMNGGSLMHDMAKDDKGLLELCRGTKVFCDSAINTGLPVNDMMGSVLGFTSACVLMSTVSLETREEIREMLSGYAHLIDKAEVNKLCDATESKLVNFVPKIAINHPKLLYMLRRKHEKKGREDK